MAKIEMNVSDLENVSGGMITYTWNETKGIGTIGFNGNNAYTLLSKDGYASVYMAHKDDWTETQILKECVRLGYVKI